MKKHRDALCRTCSCISWKNFVVENRLPAVAALPVASFTFFKPVNGLCSHCALTHRSIALGDIRRNPLDGPLFAVLISEPRLKRSGNIMGQYQD